MAKSSLQILKYLAKCNKSTNFYFLAWNDVFEEVFKKLKLSL